MKLESLKLCTSVALLLAAIFDSSVYAFVPSSVGGAASKKSHRRSQGSILRSTVEKFTPIATSDPSEYERLGLREDQVAIGVNVTEALQWVGTREDMVQKVMDDMKLKNRTKAEEEADKFFMDEEMVILYIEYQKAKAENPDLKIPGEEDQGLFSFNNIVSAYLLYLVADFAYGKYKETFGDTPPPEGVLETALTPIVTGDTTSPLVETLLAQAVVDTGVSP